MAEQSSITQVKETHEPVIMTKTNVVGVGVGYKISQGAVTDTESIMVLVRRKVPQAALTPDMLVPRAYDGVPTDVVEVGDLRALQARTDRWRPIPGGVSLGHFMVTAGTFGAVVRDRSTGARLILSNNHVLANSNNAAAGDAILQPGAVDGGVNPADVVAHLERFCPLQFSQDTPECNIATGVAAVLNLLARLIGSRHRLSTIQQNLQATNSVDAAVARPVNDTIIRNDILEIGEVSGTVSPTLLMNVRKSGRSTGLTTGRILVLNATVDVGYGTGRTARFENQIVTSPMSSPGDSGSLLVDASSLRAVGLLFAGSDQSTIHSPIQAVLDCLDIVI